MGQLLDDLKRVTRFIEIENLKKYFKLLQLQKKITKDGERFLRMQTFLELSATQALSFFVDHHK